MCIFPTSSVIITREVPAPEVTHDFSFFGAAFNVLAFVVGLLALGKPKFAFQVTVFKIKAQRHQGFISVPNFTSEGVDFAPMQQ